MKTPRLLAFVPILACLSRCSHPEAHIGDYEAKSRASFERGYLDGFNR